MIRHGNRTACKLLFTLILHRKDITFARLTKCRNIVILIHDRITDHGNLYGTIAFYKTCQKFDVKPILGLEAYFVEDRTSRPARRGHVDDGGGDGEGGRKAFNHPTPKMLKRGAQLDRKRRKDRKKPR